MCTTIARHLSSAACSLCSVFLSRLLLGFVAHSNGEWCGRLALTDSHTTTQTHTHAHLEVRQDGKWHHPVRRYSKSSGTASGRSGGFGLSNSCHPLTVFIAAQLPIWFGKRNKDTNSNTHTYTQHQHATFATNTGYLDHQRRPARGGSQGPGTWCCCRVSISPIVFPPSSRSLPLAMVEKKERSNTKCLLE